MQGQEACQILEQHRGDLTNRGVNSIAVFGSVARDSAKPESDIDILVDLDSKTNLFEFVELKTYLETLLGNPVDLVTVKALHPQLRETILREARYVY